MTFTYPIFGLVLESDRRLPRLDPAEVGELGDVVQLSVGRLPPGGNGEAGWQPLRRSRDRDAQGRPAVVVDRRTSDDACRYRYADGTTFVIAAELDRVWMAWRPPSSLEDATTYLLGPILGFLLRQRGVVALHASCGVIDGRALALAGGPGAGKSTTAAALAQLGHPTLSDDIVTVRPNGDGGYTVHPDCPILRLWPRSGDLVLGPESRLPPLSTTWDKRYLKLADHGLPAVDRPCPLGAVYILDQGWDEAGQARVVAMTPQPAVMALVVRSYGTASLSRALRAAELEVWTDLVARLPVRRLAATADCRPGALARLIAADFRALDRAAAGLAAAG